MTQHPYRSRPDQAFWRKSIGDVSVEDVDPVVSAPFRITKKDRVAAAGSCFAQHISQALQTAGLSPLVTETGHPYLPSDILKQNGYGTYTARYGNIYTARQLLQLIQRAYGEFAPADDVWVRADGRFVDPLRPGVQPMGFLSEKEVAADSRQHLSCVRSAFEQLDFLIFTLGLTECWLDRSDGTAYPVCPGVLGGQFDPGRHVFKNFEVQEVVDDLKAFIVRLRDVNPGARLILTVSPVPLVATAEDRHVLVSTTYSKSVLRVAADVVARDVAGVAYFPSFEIITGSYNRGRYFHDDCRTVTAAGVSHVMRLFLRHFVDAERAPGPSAGTGEDVSAPAPVDQAARIARLAAIACEEVALDHAGAQEV